MASWPRFAVLLPLLALTGCGRGNGLPGDLVAHLAARGIAIDPLRAEAPLSSREGWVALKERAGLAERLVKTFTLAPVLGRDPNWDQAKVTLPAGVKVRQAWGVQGRPAQFKLADGGQFEYFYLALTADGELYLLAAYAYG